MARTRKIKLPNGVEVTGVELSFRSGSEDFNEYLVDDGSVIKFKAVVTEIVRLEDVYDAEGQPVYLVNSQNVVRTSAPEELRKEPPSFGGQS